jgi:predicted metal-dependent enzyme (double-stranded beta helix superfamily)
MFDLDGFVVDCRAALTQDGSHRAVREVLARTVAEPATVLRGLGEPRRAGIQKLHHAPDLTVLNVVWGPGMTIMPHNHRMWAVIGVYTGCEDNIFWRRVPGAPDGRLEAAGAQALRVRDCVPLGRDLIHSVTNPIPRLTGAIHIYGGDFFAAERSEWDPETLQEGRYDVTKAMRLFEDSNAALAAAH